MGERERKRKKKSELEREREEMKWEELLLRLHEHNAIEIQRDSGGNGEVAPVNEGVWKNTNEK